MYFSSVRGHAAFGRTVVEANEALNIKLRALGLDWDLQHVPRQIIGPVRTKRDPDMLEAVLCA